MKLPFEDVDPIKLEAELARLGKEDPEALDRLEKQVKDYRVELARKDPNEFMAYVLRDEETQEPLRLAPYHKKLQDAVSSHTHVVIWGHNECGKSQLISIGRVLWEIGHNPNIRVCIIQAAEHLAESIVSTIKRYIEHSAEFKDVFPEIRRGDVWTTTMFNVERPGNIKDPTVIATGVHGNILGRRFDLVIIDDAVTGDNSATDYMREDVFKWLQSTPMSRLTRKARIWALGNAWHNSDAMHRFAKMAGWRAFKFPARNQVTGESNWPERWPQQRFIDWAATRTPWEVARTLDCVPYTEEAGRFRKQWFEEAIARGRGLFGEDTLCRGLGKLPPGCTTYTGVDLGISERMGTDKTVIFTIMVNSDGLITVLNVISGNWEADQICHHIVSVQQRFKSFVYVESLFAQRWILQLVRNLAPNLPVFPFQTRGGGNSRANKRHTVFGVESVAGELAQGLWTIPSTKASGTVSEEIKEWMSGCMEYDPESHTSDFLMASWFALQGARKSTGIVGYTGAVEHNGWTAIETDAESDEERRERQYQERFLFQQKQAEGFWGDLADELNLPRRSAEDMMADLGLDFPAGHD